MLKREDSFTPGQLRPGDHVLFADDEAEEFPLSYEGDIITADGPALQVRLTEVRPISVDHQLPESYPRPGEEISVLVSDVSSRRGDQTD